MKIGDLVKDKHFKQHGVVTSMPFAKRNGKEYFEYVWVIFQNGVHTRYKVRFLEVINGKRN